MRTRLALPPLFLLLAAGPAAGSGLIAKSWQTRLQTSGGRKWWPQRS